MSEGLVQAAYIIAALLFIMSLAGLSKHETAKSWLLVWYCRYDNWPLLQPFSARNQKAHYGSSLR